MNTKAKILILDDSEDILDVLSIFLASQCIKTCTAKNLELFKTNLIRFKPDLIILDVYIRGQVDGREICKTIKAGNITKHIPVILMSVSKKGLEKFEECEANAIIEKPFDLFELLGLIKSLVNNEEKGFSEINDHSLLQLISKKKWPVNSVIIPTYGNNAPLVV